MDSRQESVMVEFVCRSFEINSLGALAEGSEITLVLRPELLSIAPDGKGMIKAKVRRSLYLGNAIEYEIEADGQVLTFSETHPDRMKMYGPGSVIDLEVHNEIVHYLLT